MKCFQFDRDCPGKPPNDCAMWDLLNSVCLLVERERTEVILNKQYIDWNEGADLEEEADA